MIIAIYNNKGGVGKSTLTAHIGFRAADTNRAITVVDADRQLNTMNWLSNHRYTDEDSYYNGSVQVTTSLSAVQNQMVVIDCPPAFEVVQRFSDVDLWLLPVGGRFALDGAMNVIAEIRRIERSPRIVLVANKVEANTQIGRDEIAEIEKLEVELFRTAIPSSNVMRKAEMSGIPAWRVPYGSRSATTVALQEISDWVLAGCSTSGTIGGNHA